MGEAVLKDRTAIVTGAGKGIGKATSLALAGAGAQVALAARTARDLDAVREEIEAMGGVALSVPTDVTKEEDVKALVRAAVEQFGRLDVVINNAGVAVPGAVEKTATADWDRSMAVNARGPFMLCRESIPELRKSGGGFIVNIVSVVGVKGYVNQGAYTASKHALMGMTKVLAQELQDDGIRVHAICPGGVATELVSSMRPDLDLSVLMQPQEIADIVMFLVTRTGNAVIDNVNVRRATSAPWF